MANFIRIGLLVISWGSIILFYDKKSLRKFAPVATLATMFLLIQSMLAIPFKWWTASGGVKNKIFNDLSFILGPFITGTLWIFRFTYGKFGLYMLLNTIMDYLLAYPLNALFEKWNVYKLVKMKPKHIFITSMVYAVTIYLYQNFISKNSREKEHN